MTQAVVLDIIREAFLTIIMVAGPVLLVALIVGLIISIFQATTQIQEQTLSFVPKILAVIITLIIAGNYMINKIVSFTTGLYSMISNIG